MQHIFHAAVFTFALLFGMLLFLEIGRRLGVRKLREDPEGMRSETSAIEGAVFALLGLLIAFTFSGAASRFDERRALVVEEANDIGTAWLRLDLVPAGAQPAIRNAFRQYVDARIATYRQIPDVKAVQADMARAAELQQVIWAKSVAALGSAGWTRSITPCWSFATACGGRELVGRGMPCTSSRRCRRSSNRMWSSSCSTPRSEAASRTRPSRATSARAGVPWWWR